MTVDAVKVGAIKTVDVDTMQNMRVVVGILRVHQHIGVVTG